MLRWIFLSQTKLTHADPSSHHPPLSAPSVRGPLHASYRGASCRAGPQTALDGHGEIAGPPVRSLGVARQRRGRASGRVSRVSGWVGGWGTMADAGEYHRLGFWGAYVWTTGVGVDLCLCGVLGLAVLDKLLLPVGGGAGIEDSAMARVLFVIVFALSVLLAQLLVCEAVGWNLAFHPFFHYLIWNMVLRCLCTLLCVVCPLYQAYRSLWDAGFKRQRAMVLSVPLYIGMLLAGMWVSDRFSTVRGSDAGEWTLEKGMLRISAVGTTVAAALAGYGAVKTPYDSLAVFTKCPSMSEIQACQVQVINAYEGAATKQRKAAIARAQASARSSGGGERRKAGGGGLLGAVRGAAAWWGIGGGAKDSAVRALEDEAEMLGNLSQDLFLNVHTMVRERERALAAKTTAGSVRNGLGVVLSLYCVYRVLGTGWMLLGGGGQTAGDGVTTPMAFVDGQGDPVALFVARGLLWVPIFGHILGGIDVASWAQVLSSMFIAFLVVASLNGFLTQFGKVTGFAARHAGGSRLASPLVILGAAQLTGAHLVSTVILMRRSLAGAHRDDFFDLLFGQGRSVLNVDALHTWFDVVFGASALLGIALITLHHRMTAESLAAGRTQYRTSQGRYTTSSWE